MPKPDKLPEFIKQKIDLEHEIIKEYGSTIKLNIPHKNSIEMSQLVQNLEPHMEYLV